MYIEGAIFDLDGVISKTSKQHSRAWKKLFDSFLLDFSKKENIKFVEFDLEKDYLAYVDGKPRILGIKSFLESRQISLIEGNNKSIKDFNTVWGLGKLKDQTFRRMLTVEGVDLYQSTIDLINEMEQAELPIAVVSSSKNCRRVLESGKISNKFKFVFDGTDLAKEELPGKPEPHLFLRAAEIMNIQPKKTAIFEDAVAGIQSGKKGGFGYLIGINRGSNKEALTKAGSDIVVRDLESLGFDSSTSSLVKKSF